jgi:uncharacterized membrane protein SpoIIM required for sporulation
VKSRIPTTLRSAEFRKGREESWRRLETLVDRAEKQGVDKLGAEELQQLPLLYRTAASSLSVARATVLDRNLILYLENLALRGFFVIHGPRSRLSTATREFLLRGFPAAVRACRWQVLISALLLLAGIVAGFLLAEANEDWVTTLVPASLAGGRGPNSTAQELLKEEIFQPWQGFTRSFLLMANFLFTHNSTLALMAFGLGIMAGIPTALLLVYQGLVVGSFAALHYNRGLLVDFFGWISIHGVTELGALILCSAGGFKIAGYLLFPGHHKRLENLRLHGRTAAALGGGAVLMLLVAGIIEGGLRQLVGNTGARFAIAAATALFWGLYFLSGRKRDSHGPAA